MYNDNGIVLFLKNTQINILVQVALLEINCMNHSNMNHSNNSFKVTLRVVKSNCLLVIRQYPTYFK